MLHKLKSACLSEKNNSEQVRLQVFRKSRWTNRQVPQFDRQTHSNSWDQQRYSIGTFRGNQQLLRDCSATFFELSPCWPKHEKKSFDSLAITRDRSTTFAVTRISLDCSTRFVVKPDGGGGSAMYFWLFFLTEPMKTSGVERHQRGIKPLTPPPDKSSTVWLSNDFFSTFSEDHSNDPDKLFTLPGHAEFLIILHNAKR